MSKRLSIGIEDGTLWDFEIIGDIIHAKITPFEAHTIDTMTLFNSNFGLLRSENKRVRNIVVDSKYIHYETVDISGIKNVKLTLDKQTGMLIKKKQINIEAILKDRLWTWIGLRSGFS